MSAPALSGLPSGGIESDVAARPGLAHPSIDATLLGGLAVVVWIALVGLDATGRGVPVDGWLFWTAAFVGSMHFAMSYRLAYHHGLASVRSHPLALAIGPAVLAFALVAAGALAMAGSTAAADAMRIGITGVFALTMWHYVKQTFGVVRLAARFAEFRLTPGEATVLRYGLYPLWFVSLVSFVSGRTLVDVDGFEIRADLLPATGDWPRNALVGLTVAVLSWVLARAGRRQRRAPPLTVVAPCVAAMLWVGLTPDLLAAVVLLPAFHALQYLAVCYSAQLGLNNGTAPVDPRQLGQLAQIFAAAGAVGLLATHVVPDVLGSVFAIPAEPGLWLVAVFVFLNLHHYLIDATIWRSGGELVGLVAARGTASGAARP